jgi:hypothetical protein
MPSLSTVYKAIKEGNTRKLISWKNIRRDPEAQMEYLERIAHVSPDRLIDIDGIIHNPKDFLPKYGWSPKGQECTALLFRIEEKVYAVHAAATERGFIAWDIFEGTVTEREVANFVDKVQNAKAFNDRSFGIFDNAANQRTDCVRRKLETVFRGRYHYCSPYSPELKPVENAFSMIRKYIQSHHSPTTNHIDQINAAFHYYSDAPGQHGHLLYNLFDVYRRNHELWLNAQ